MLNRQKTLLQLLLEAGRPVEHIELTKWSFLLRYETATGGGNAFYEFVPYQFGPFSFALYQEAAKLNDQHYIASHDEHAWKIGAQANFPSPPSIIARDVMSIVHRFRNQSIDDLVDYVYDKYPKFTINSRRKKLAPRPVAGLAVNTAGYEGLSIDAFLYMLIENGVERLIDVRNNPIARRYGFHKSTLSRLTSRLGIEYTHLPELGIPSRQRRGLNGTADNAALFLDYERTTLEIERDAISLVCTLVTEKPSVLVCMEAEPQCCHRSRLAARIANLVGLPIQHLAPS